MRVLPSTTDVAIVGAGPTGLALACVLAAKGIDFVLIDRLGDIQSTSRAAVIHARTLEVLDTLGVTDQLHTEGRIVSRFTVRDRDRVLAAIPFSTLPTRYPYTLMVPQQITERILLNRLRELGGDVCRPYVVDSVRQETDRVAVTVAAESGSIQTVYARYLVGADGMHSTVRTHAGIGFTGDAYEHSFVLADVRMDWPISADEVMLFFSPDGLMVVAPLPGVHHRIVATMDDAPERPGVSYMQQLLDTRGPMTRAARIHDIVWSSRFRVHYRLADQYRAGRILLAGDAAHVHSPAGAQGMNTGIQDAVVLAHILADVVGRQADERRLHEYERRRRPVAKRVIAFTDRMTTAAMLRGRHARMIRNAAIGVIGGFPKIPRALAAELAGLRNRRPVYA